MWHKIKSFLRIGATQERVLAGAISALQEASRHADQLLAIISSQTAMLHQWEKINGELLAALRPSEVTPSESASGRPVTKLCSASCDVAVNGDTIAVSGRGWWVKAVFSVN